MRYMLSCRPLIAASGFCIMLLSAASLQAAEPADLTTLRAKYEAELKAGTDLLRARQIARLEALAKTLTQRGDLDGVVAVRNEIATLGGTPTSDAVKAATKAPATATGLQAALKGTSWTWEAFDGTSQLTFMADGTIKDTRWGPGRFTWRATSPDSVSIEDSQHHLARLKFDPTMSSYSGSDFKEEHTVSGHPAGSSASPGTSGSSSDDPFGTPRK